MKNIPISLHVTVVKKDFRDKTTNTLASGRIVNAEPIFFFQLDNGEELLLRGASLTQAKGIQEGDQGIITYRQGYDFFDEFVKDDDFNERVSQVMDPDEFLEKYPDEGVKLAVTKKDRIVGFVLGGGLLALAAAMYMFVITTE